MFIKLNYTTDKRLTAIFRVVTDIINTPSVTSISSLQARATAASYDATILAGLDATNSEIVRTVSPSGVLAHYATPGAPNGGGHLFTLQFGSYDNTDRKYYAQYLNSNPGSAQTVTSFTIGNSITGGTMASAQMPLTEAETNTTAGTHGTVLTVGNSFTAGATTATGASGFNTVRTFWAYITNTTMIWGTTNGTSTVAVWQTISLTSFQALILSRNIPAMIITILIQMVLSQ